MQKVIVSLFFILAIFRLSAQTVDISPTNTIKGSNSLASFDIYVPLGVFSQSHFAGVGLNYSWSHHRYGIDVVPQKIIGFTFNAGADYYFGKKTKTAGYDFTYGNYLYLHIMPGMIFNPWAKGNISLLAGPSMGVYKNNTDWGFTAAINGSYYLTKYVSVGPGVNYKKHPDTHALWTLFIRGSFTF